jgi:hypothetical protein
VWIRGQGQGDLEGSSPRGALDAVAVTTQLSGLYGCDQCRCHADDELDEGNHRMRPLELSLSAQKWDLVSRGRGETGKTGPWCVRCARDIDPVVRSWRNEPKLALVLS